MFVVIGNATVDLFVSGMEHIPRFAGDEFTTDSLTFCRRPLQMVLGGNGANSAYVLASLGAPTALCTALGRDKPGEIVAGWLAERGVDLSGTLRHAEQATSTSTILMDDALNRITFHHRGASASLRFEDIPAQLLEQAEVVLLCGYTLLTAMRGEGFVRALTAAHAGGATTAIDIGPAIEPPAVLDELLPLLPLVDYFLTNAYELAVCTGVADPEAGAARVREAGAGTVVVKRGKEGVLVRGEGVALDVPAFPVEAQVTVGAGDSFNAGFLYSIQRGSSLEEAARFANATAALVVSAAHGVLSAPTLEQVEALAAGA